jgi:hypothetical protein
MMTRDLAYDALQDALRDAFAAYWRNRDTEQAEALWEAYCVLEDQLTITLSPSTRQTGRHSTQAAGSGRPPAASHPRQA